MVQCKPLRVHHEQCNVLPRIPRFPRLYAKENSTVQLDRVAVQCSHNSERTWVSIALYILNYIDILEQTKV